jgi:predicted TIM-barrel fold metal-dependent hydrolase
MKIVGLEEHFATKEVVAAWECVEPRWQDLAMKGSLSGDKAERLLDLGSQRLAAMDDAGIDVAVLSLTTPGVQNLDPSTAVDLARSANDQLASAVHSQPDRFQGFATLPTPAPQIAAKELERAVMALGLQGAMLHGRTRDRNLSDQEFWPIFEAADALRTPLYMHPQSPQQGVLDAYYRGFGSEIDALFARPGIGWHYETGIQIVRLILAGVFDRFPNLQIMTGHWGEVVLFYLDRMDLISTPAKLPRKISEYFQQHVLVTASGVFSQRYLRWALEVLGPDRILFATDYPCASAPQGAARRFLEGAQISEEDRTKIASGNWEALCVAGLAAKERLGDPQH